LDLAGAIRGRFAEVAGVIDQWKAVRLDEERSRSFASDALQLRWPGRRPKADLADVLQVRRNEDAGESLWHIYNRVQLCDAPHNWHYVLSAVMWS